MENLNLLFLSGVWPQRALRDFHRVEDPHPGHGLLLECCGCIPTVFGNEKI